MRIASSIGLGLALLVLVPGCGQDRPGAGGSSEKVVAARADASLQGFLAEIEAARTLSAEGRTPAADAALRGLLADDRFATLDTGQRHWLLSLAADVAMRSGDTDRARDHVLDALSMASQPATLMMLAWIESERRDWNAAMRALTRLLRESPARVETIDPDLFSGTLQNPERDSQDRLELLDAMFAAPALRDRIDFDAHWYELASLRLARGEIQQASAAARAVAAPAEAIRILSDRRFDALAEAGPLFPDIVALAHARVADARARVAQAPEDRELLIYLLRSLLQTGAAEEVLTLTDDYVTDAAGEKLPSHGAEEELNWIFDMRSQAFRQQGRWDDAVAMLRRGREIGESEQLNVSQSLNLAFYLVRFGRAQEARVVAGKVGALSGYGAMVQASILHFAALEIGDAPLAQISFEKLREGAAIAPTIWIEALLLRGDDERATSEFVAMLREENHRGEALMQLQTFRRLPSLPGEARLQDGWERLRASAPVKDALADVGRASTYDLFE